MQVICWSLCYVTGTQHGDTPSDQHLLVPLLCNCGTACLTSLNVHHIRGAELSTEHPGCLKRALPWHVCDAFI